MDRTQLRTYEVIVNRVKVNYRLLFSSLLNIVYAVRMPTFSLTYFGFILYFL